MMKKYLSVIYRSNILVFFGILLISIALSSCGSNSEPVSIPKIQNNKILALGDSLTEGYGVAQDENYPAKLQKILTENGYNTTVINAGISGETSEQLKDRVTPYLEDPQNIPGVAILVIGGNDGLRKKSVENMKKNIIETIDLLREKNIIVVLGAMQLNFMFGLDYSKEFKQVYFDIAQEKDVYFFEHFLEGVQGKYKLNLPDNIHPNSQGYDIIAKRLFEYLQTNKLIQK